MKRHGLALLAAAVVAACAAENDASPLIFGQGVTVGISVGASAAAANTPEITVGVKQANLAVVPTVVPKAARGENDEGSLIVANDAPNGGSSAAYDALSAFGSFSGKTQTNQVDLGIFFATGIAAQNLARGFQCKLAEGKHKECATADRDTQAAAAPSPPSPAMPSIAPAAVTAAPAAPLTITPGPRPIQ